jgi:hypothetical protein
MTAKVKKPTPAEAWRDEIKKSVKGKPERQAVDDFAAAIGALAAALGKTQALTIYAKAGLLITLAKDEAKQP